MADINDRLERLSRRDELTRRVLQHRIVPAEVAGVGTDFLDVVEAVANVVRRHPGMSIMLAPGDGRRGSAVVRVTEQHGDAEVALVTPQSGDAGGAGSPGRARTGGSNGPEAAQPDESTPGTGSAGGGSSAAGFAGEPAGATAATPVPDGSGGPEHQPAVWRPPSRWQAGVTESEPGRQQDPWRYRR